VFTGWSGSSSGGIEAVKLLPTSRDPLLLDKEVLC